MKFLDPSVQPSEVMLHDCQERLQLLMQGSNDGFWDWNIASGECYVSERWKELRGFPRGTQIADPVSVWKEGLHSEDRDRAVQALFDYLQRKTDSFNIEYRVRRLDGSYIWLLDRGQAIWNAEGNAVRIAGSETDITYLKHTEEALRQSELIYKTLADTMPQIVWITRADGYHEYYNQRWYDYTGLTREQAEGKGWKVVLHPDDVAIASQRWEESLQTGKPYSVEYRLRCAADSEYRWFLGRALPLRDASGLMTRWFGTCTDIHDQKCAIEERAQALERERAARIEQEKANRMKDEFLAVLSHELRSPLNPILGWIKLLRTRKLAANMFEQALATIDRNAQLQSQLIEDLLDISRILRGKLKLTIAPVNLARVVDAALETVRLQAEAKTIQIHKQFDPSVPPVEGDFNRLQQVVWNLLTNAVKFTPEGGQIYIHLTGTDRAQLMIRDTGKGISPEFLPHVFERFRQADTGTTRQFGGLGLGLSIVRHVVEMHHGTIAVESAGDNQGTTFTVSLPIIRQKEQELGNPDQRNEHRGAMPLSPLAGLKILVVDDEEDARYLVAFLLEQQGAQVQTASSAKAALTLLNQGVPDILVSDLGMPEMDGYSLIRKLRERIHQKLPAIAVTAYAREEDRQAALSAGFNAHLTKPIEPTELVKMILAIA